MDIRYKGNDWLKDGLVQQGLWDFVQTTKEKFTQPLQVPDYATAGEKERVAKTSEYYQKNVYAYRHDFHNAVEQLGDDMTDYRPVPYDGYPVLYELAVFATQTLCNMDPIVYLFTPKGKTSVYQARALDYLDKAYIYISDRFVEEEDMLSPEELLFIIGHELGHTQCHHSTMGIAGQNGDHHIEYSADRAGMIACGRWLQTQYPDMLPQALAERCARACIASLTKLQVGFEALAKGSGVDWKQFSYDKLDEYMNKAFRNANKFARDTGSHPINERRGMAAQFFSESELFYRYLGLDPEAYKNLLNDKQLDQAMYQL